MATINTAMGIPTTKIKDIMIRTVILNTAMDTMTERKFFLSKRSQIAVADDVREAATTMRIPVTHTSKMGDTTRATRMIITMTNITTKVPVAINNMGVDTVAEGDVVAMIRKKNLRPLVILR
jgi:hypothetical protein